MKRVAFLAPDLNHRHGWAHASLSLLEALARRGLPMTVLAARTSPPTPIPFVGAGLFPPETAGGKNAAPTGEHFSDEMLLNREKTATQFILPSITPRERLHLFRQAALIPTARRLIRDCALVHALVEPYAPLAAALATGRPYLVTGHGSYVTIGDSARWPFTSVYRAALRRAHLVCVSQHTARVARAAFPSTDVRVIPNGVDVERYLHIPRQPQQRPTVLAVGAIKPRKGTLELVQAMATVRQHIPDVQCILIGRLDAGGDYPAQVRAKIAELDLGDCVQMLGAVDNATVDVWYGRANVFALPSLNQVGRFEGFGLVYLEASAAGLPVIGTTECGAEDAIADGVTGLLVAQGRIREELPNALLRLLTDSALAARMGAAGRERAAAQTWDAVAEQWLTLYATLIP